MRFGLLCCACEGLVVEEELLELPLAFGTPAMCGECLDELDDTAKARAIIRATYGVDIDDDELAAAMAHADQINAATAAGDTEGEAELWRNPINPDAAPAWPYGYPPVDPALRLILGR